MSVWSCKVIISLKAIVVPMTCTLAKSLQIIFILAKLPVKSEAENDDTWLIIKKNKSSVRFLLPTGWITNKIVQVPNLCNYNFDASKNAQRASQAYDHHPFIPDRSVAPLETVILCSFKCPANL
ncbi:hypothetical protein OnM2_090024 [Erysiphe neolycopersici]|uniref:Uncharacterized protein n=1 Tax=Erysiphe neolycopersici TaxID=212602 RepID=A0A420HD07_9PEZI|nr:hypothetical protein OnM2_090024 [Erysiphe neolycopersici]